MGFLGGVGQCFCFGRLLVVVLQCIGQVGYVCWWTVLLPPGGGAGIWSCDLEDVDLCLKVSHSSGSLVGPCLLRCKSLMLHQFLISFHSIIPLSRRPPPHVSNSWLPMPYSTICYSLFSQENGLEGGTKTVRIMRWREVRRRGSMTTDAPCSLDIVFYTAMYTNCSTKCYTISE